MSVMRLIFALLVVPMIMKEELKCVFMVHGVLFVMISGEHLMQLLSVIN